VEVISILAFSSMRVNASTHTNMSDS